jgi:uroporphyrinogen decarboxylase
VTVEEYEEFGRPYDLRVLDAVSGADVRMLHIHGTEIMFDLLTDYPVDILNWHDRKTAPSLREAAGRYSGCLAGGIDEWETLAKGTAEQIAAEVRDALAQTEGRRHLVAAGCVIPIDLSDERLQTVRAAVASDANTAGAS